MRVYAKAWLRVRETYLRNSTCAKRRRRGCGLASAVRTLRLALLLALALSLTGCTNAFSGCDDGLEYGSGGSPAVDQGVPAEKVAGIPAERYSGSGEDAFGTEVAQDSVLPDGELRVRFLDVGQGDCALVTCDGEALLVDGGPSSASSKVYAVLNTLGISHLDYIVATHPDADHCGGIAGALNYADCGCFYCSVVEHDTKTFQNVIDYLGDTPVTVPRVGDSFALGDARVEFVGPVEPSRDSNDGSLVCLLTYGETSFLLTGDAESESEAAMVAAGTVADVDVLKVGHHGSDSSSSPGFLSTVLPEYAVISVGQNSYGHPDDEVLRRLQDAGAETLRTDELGAIVFESDGHGLTVWSTKGPVCK